MAEGLDQAAAAFHTELNPEAQRARDDGGRFVSRPESMFSPRPLEGDPLTGDTRDAGEDARLAARERRLADGRAEEGDEDGERSPVQDGARARNARRDVARHEPAEAQPERHRGEGPDDQDAQRPDRGAEAEGERGDAERNAEQDAAGKWAISLDGEPVEKIEVFVDGQPLAVTLDEMVRGYIDGETNARRVAQVGEAVKAIEQTYAQTTQMRDHYIQQLQHHAEDYAALLPKEPDWDAFYAQDPKAARETQKTFQAALQKLYELRQRRAYEIQQRDQENARRTAEFARNGWEAFKQYTRITDQPTLNNEVAAMRKAAIEFYGFAEQEVETTYDPRMLAVLWEGSKYRRALASKPRPIMPDKGRTLAPGAAKPIGSAARRSIDDAHRQLAKTGRLDDATVLFQRLIR
jgi:hypothetical protein